jgi:hypothetical protein
LGYIRLVGLEDSAHPTAYRFDTPPRVT